MLPSGNDAAFLVAEFGGFLLQKGFPADIDILNNTIEHRKGGFVFNYLSEMNFLAHKFGMVNSNFANPHGLNNPQNYSTAEDVAKLCTHAMKNKKFRQIVHTRTYKYEYSLFEINRVVDEEGNVEEEEVISFCKNSWENTNKMLGEGWSGIKTGITPNAGPCLAASVCRTFSGKEY